MAEAQHVMMCCSPARPRTKKINSTLLTSPRPSGPRHSFNALRRVFVFINDGWGSCRRAVPFTRVETRGIAARTSCCRVYSRTHVPTLSTPNFTNRHFPDDIRRRQRRVGERRTSRTRAAPLPVHAGPPESSQSPLHSEPQRSVLAMLNCFAQLTSSTRRTHRRSHRAGRSKRRLLSRSSSYRSVNRSESTFAPIFTCFALLPPELRLKIWAYALPDPCVITLRYTTDQSKQKGPLAPITAFSAARAPPVLLRTCSESRELALQFYCRAFSSNPIRPRAPPGPARVWINFSVDAIHLQAEAPAVFLQLSRVIRESDRRRIRVLALTKNRRWGLPDYVCQFIASCGNLREVVIVHQPPGDELEEGELQEVVCVGSRNEEWRDHAYDVAVHERRSLVQFKRDHAAVLKNWRIPRVRLGDCSVEERAREGRRGIVV